jgi:hypothetical protein
MWCVRACVSVCVGGGERGGEGARPWTLYKKMKRQNTAERHEWAGPERVAPIVCCWIRSAARWSAARSHPHWRLASTEAQSQPIIRWRQWWKCSSLHITRACPWPYRPIGRTPPPSRHCNDRWLTHCLFYPFARARLASSPLLSLCISQ